MQHNQGFLKMVEDAKTRVREVSVDEASKRLSANTGAVLVDVREDLEWAAGHAVNAEHLGKGVFERDLEAKFPNPDTELILYCGGGFRSALAADAAQKMGYRNVWSLAGGWRAMTAAGWRVKAGS
jgi:rhodanese-related sulfurtransferase